MLTPCLIAFGVHLLSVYGIDNMAFAHVIQACGSSWLQVSHIYVYVKIIFQLIFIKHFIH